MITRYSANRKDVGGGALIVGILFFIRPVIGFVRDPRFDGSILLALGILLLIVMLLIFTVFYTYITIDGKYLRIVRALLLRKTVPITAIHALRHEYTFGTTFPGIDVHYVDRSGSQRVGVIPVGMFKRKDVAAILHQLKALNPAIKVDERTEAIMKKYPN